MTKQDDIRRQRMENEETFQEHRSFRINWVRLRELIERVPYDCDKGATKEALTPQDRLKFEVRDGGVCYICESVFCYGSCNSYVWNGPTTYKMSHLHHIIPNGTIKDENITTLCTHCHQLVHQILYLDGRWKYTKPL
jgi:5-methylcytosine-specific restriction endonuclease McrA